MKNKSQRIITYSPCRSANIVDLYAMNWYSKSVGTAVKPDEPVRSIDWMYSCCAGTAVISTDENQDCTASGGKYSWKSELATEAMLLHKVRLISRYPPSAPVKVNIRIIFRSHEGVIVFDLSLPKDLQIPQDGLNGCGSRCDICSLSDHDQKQDETYLRLGRRLPAHQLEQCLDYRSFSANGDKQGTRDVSGQNASRVDTVLPCRSHTWLMHGV